MKKLMSYSVVLFVITVILLLIIPMPAGMVDVAIILNMSFSMMILVITMTIREPLEFSIFPSLLLITTLFRLGINVSSTRNILSHSGSSGKVIAAFGDFVLQGNVVVGMIIFLIIVLMQFIVITKGAERVAEVAARFTLDAMPGKQMAIDADLSSGLINEQQAKEQRSKIQREADFYGSMDGATKIVKGDAPHLRIYIRKQKLYRKKYAYEYYYRSYIPALKNVSLFSGVPAPFWGGLFGFFLSSALCHGRFLPFLAASHHQNQLIHRKIQFIQNHAQPVRHRRKHQKKHHKPHCDLHLKIDCKYVDLGNHAHQDSHSRL